MQETLPFVTVARLPPSASFYSAITQPLGLRYISATSSSIFFGTASPDPKPVFEVKSISDGAAQPLQRARILFSAPSRSAVAEFQAAALRANPVALIGGDGDPSFPRHRSPTPASAAVGGGEHVPLDRAKIRDLDGNIMEVSYVNPPAYPAGYGGSTVRHTQSTTQEVGRILDWNLDVAASEPSVAGSAAAGPATALTRRPSGEPHTTVVRRSVTTSSTTQHPPPPAREDSNSLSLSTGAVVGTVLGAVAVGAAVGGALTYTLMRNERERAPRQEYDPPTFQRRSTFPDRYPDPRGRYVEVERTVEKVRYPEEYPPVSKKYPPPTYLARYSGGGPQSRALEDVDDRTSRHTSHYSGTRTRGRSEAASTRRPLMIDDIEYRSVAAPSKHTAGPKMLMDAEYRSSAGSKYSAGSKHSAHPKGGLLVDADYRSFAGSRHVVAPPSRQPTEASYRSRAPSHAVSHAPSKHTAVASRYLADDDRPSRAGTAKPLTHRPPEAETYISARSHRTDKSASTVRPIRPEGSRAVSRYTSGTIKVPGVSRAPSHASAKKVPLPASAAGSSKANWDDDVVSLAPSDSISCVGSRRSGRSYH